MNAIVNEMAKKIANEFHPLKIVLFGSYARGEETADSDVDLLVVMPQVDNTRKQAIEIRRALADFPASKDIIVTTPDEIERRGNLIGTVLRPALHEGKVLYERT